MTREEWEQLQPGDLIAYHYYNDILVRMMVVQPSIDYVAIKCQLLEKWENRKPGFMWHAIEPQYYTRISESVHKQSRLDLIDD